MQKAVSKQTRLTQLQTKKPIIMKDATIKTVKIQGRYRESVVLHGSKEVPWLTTSGVWLEKLGFHIGDTVRITSRKGLLVIEVLDKQSQKQQSLQSEIRKVQRTLKQMM